MNISTKVAGIILENPVFNASGPKCTTAEELANLGTSASGAVLTKSCTLEAREGNPSPRYVAVGEKSYASINSMGLPNLGYKFYSSHLSELSKYKKPIFVSVSGMCLEDNVTIISEFTKKEEVAAIELNLSCPNVIGKPQIAYDFEYSAKILEEVQKVCTKPLGVKLPPYFDFAHFQAMADVLNKSNVSFITCINSPGNGLIIDPEKEEVLIKPKGGFGGIGGKIVKPFGLSNVRKFRELLRDDIDIIGVGGITEGIDIFEYILAGASAVQIGTALEDEGADVFERLIKEFKEYLEKKGYNSIDEFKNKLKTL